MHSIYTLLFAVVLSVFFTSCTTADTKNPIQLENEQAGTQEWLLKNPNIPLQENDFILFNTGIRSPAIEGYLSNPYAKTGDTLTFFVSTNPVDDFKVEVFRMGYYNGDGGRLITSIGPFTGNTQPTPEMDTTRLMECLWDPSGQLVIQSDWLSGVYLAKLTTIKNGYDSYMIFVLADEREADYNYQCADMTWQCYNRWPEIHSIYNDGKKDNYGGKDVFVSWDRPYGKYHQLLNQPLALGSGEFLLWEFPFIFWAEEQGYDITYTSNWNTHEDGVEGLTRTKGFINVGHDEYWTEKMYENIKAARDSGVHLGLFNANSISVYMDLMPSSSGIPDRIMARKGRFKDENMLMGVQSAGGVIGGAPWRCMAPDHWIFEGTNMQFGEGIPGLVGWEYHSDAADIPGLVKVAYGYSEPNRYPEKDSYNGRGHYTASCYETEGQTFVFNAATIWWADGLSEPPGYMRSQEYNKRNGPDKRVQRITKNILDRMQK